MNIYLQNLIIHNFLSYGHAELDLTDKHYCLVSGVNNNPRDNALSNGSGKSSWGSAICWALTGQTINGLSKNIKNINIAEKECWVTLEFKVDNNSYKITRYAEPKSDLKIIVNGEDVSGKGIRESETVLAKYLPDLTSQLIASIIILGQGLPGKFTSNSPSGRKEVLEKLSKSDFMIQDLKERINKRLNELNARLRKFEDTLLVLNTNANSADVQISKLEQKLSELQIVRNFDAEIDQLKTSALQKATIIKELQDKIKNINESIEKANNQLTEINNSKANEINADNTEFNGYYTEYLNRKSNITSVISTLNNRISELKNIRDVCPTCGQKIPNVVKPSTEKEEKELVENQIKLQKLNESYNNTQAAHQKTLSEINAKYIVKLNDLQKYLADLKKDLAELHSDSNAAENSLSDIKSKLAKVEADKENYNKNLSDIQNELLATKTNKEELLKNIEETTNSKNTISEHIKVVNQMNTLIKRDFRGYLLKDIIDYINSKCKEYAYNVFGNTDLDFVLDGNNINISYCGKFFENLSGGEGQRIDIIIQLSIRDMMKNYLGFSSNILILDEVTDYLDEPGCAAILGLINEKLTDVESIFIISHHADELGIPADYQMVVTKNENGVSTISWQ